MTPGLLYGYLRRNEGIKTFVYTMRDKKYRKMDIGQLEKQLGKIYSKTMGTKADFSRPKSFTEKIQWLKLYDCTEIKEKLSDKYLVRDWISNKIGEQHLVPLLGAWEDFASIPFSKLSQQYCLKMNHGSGMNYIVKNSADFDKNKARALFKTWMNRPYYAGSMEFQYYGIPRKIIAEQYIEELGGGLYDYKIHCFNGVPRFIQCIGDRNVRLHKAYQNNYDLKWNKQNWIFEDYPRFPYDVPKPRALDKMLEIASTLSEGFSYVRVDLYEVGDRILFGEMTFTPASGIYPYQNSWTREMDLQLGEMMVLPHKSEFRALNR